MWILLFIVMIKGSKYNINTLCTWQMPHVLYMHIHIFQNAVLLVHVLYIYRYFIVYNNIWLYWRILSCLAMKATQQLFIGVLFHPLFSRSRLLFLDMWRVVIFRSYRLLSCLIDFYTHLPIFNDFISEILLKQCKILMKENIEYFAYQASLEGR